MEVRAEGPDGFRKPGEGHVPRGDPGNQGRKALVLATYSSYSGRVRRSFRSSRPAPEIFRSSNVISTGLKTVHSAPGVPSARTKKLHQTTASPK